LYTEAARFPDARFVILPARVGAGNVAGIEFLTEGAGYVAGVTAGHLLGEGRAGVLRGSGGDWLEAVEAGFASGVASVAADHEMVTADLPMTPADLVERGVTVSLYAADTVDEAIISDARDTGLRLVATDPRALDGGSDVVVAAIDLDVAEAMVRLAREVVDGRFQGRPYTFDLGSGVVDVVLSVGLTRAEHGELFEAYGVAKSEVTAGIVELEKLGL
jgi:basic membrane lipoprotein Med (substrate-binding protein (PBP1-ABC) superfamily)